MDSITSKSLDKSNPFTLNINSIPFVSAPSIFEDESRSLNDLLKIVEQNLVDNNEPFTPNFSATKTDPSGSSSSRRIKSFTTDPQVNKNLLSVDWSRANYSAPELTTNRNKSLVSQPASSNSIGSFAQIPEPEQKDLNTEKTELKNTSGSTKSAKTEILELLEYSRKNKLRKGNDEQMGIFGTFKILELRKYLDRH